MNIEKVTSEDLRRMENQEGLILQGCGGGQLHGGAGHIELPDAVRHAEMLQIGPDFFHGHDTVPPLYLSDIHPLHGGAQAGGGL